MQTGLLALGFFTIFNLTALFFRSGQVPSILWTSYPIGGGLALTMIFSAQWMRRSQNQLNQLRSTLEDHVNEATAELDALVKRFIEKDEQERIQIGQNIHDGVGQYLTGMLLQSEVLAQRLKTANHSETLLAERMIQRINNCMQTIRNLSRSQIPIQFLEIPLSTALEEMVSYLNAVTSASLHLNLIGSSRSIPAELAQHLFRIAHETITSAIHTYKARIVDIQLTTQANCCTISIEVSQMPHQRSDFSFPISKIVKYRAQTTGGKLKLSTPPGADFCLECLVCFDKEAS